MSERRLPPSWLSLLYVPADQQARIAQAPACGPHAVILDLEDFVAPSAKEAARRNIEPAATAMRQQGIDAVVRINRRIDLAVADLDRSVTADVAAIMVTKTLGADHLQLLDEVVGTLEIRRGLPAGAIALIPLIETAAALDRMDSIGAAGGRLVAMGLGGEDIARECGMRASAATLQYAKQKMIFQAVAAGLIPLGYLASVVDFKDEATFADMVARSREFGFQAATCVNAAQVRIVNRVYAPTRVEVDHAQAFLQRDAHGTPHGDDAGSLPGEDQAGRRRASLVLARAQRVAAAS